MIEKRGDLWKSDTAWIAVTTNGICKANGDAVMGAGCAKEARDKLPGIDAKLGKLLRQYGNQVHNLGAWSVPDLGARVIVSLPTKAHWRDSSTPELIRRSCRELRDLALRSIGEDGLLPTVALPRPGCSNGRLGWSVVKPIVEEELPDPSFVVMYL